MIQVKLGELINMIPVLQVISQIPNSSGKMLYKISKLILKVNQEVNSFDAAKRGMLNKYGVKDENGNYLMDENNREFIIQEDKKSDFQKEFSELANSVVELDIDYFQAEDFNDLKLTPQQLISLMSIIK